MRRAASFLLAALTVPPATAQPAADGPEFQVNTFTLFSQFSPDAVVLPNGDILVVFSDIVQDLGGSGVFARHFDGGGNPLDPSEFLVNVETLWSQGFPAVASSGNGDFVVVWGSYDQDGDYGGVFARVFDSGGAPLTGEFQVNQYTTGDQGSVSVAMRPDGDFVVVWDSFGQDGDGFAVFGRRMQITGAPRGDEFRVNVFTTAGQRDPDVAMDQMGNFVVTWHGYQQDGSDSGILGRRFGSSGSPLTGEFLINEWTTNTQKSPSISMHPTGEFVVVWRTFASDGSGYGVAGRRFHSSGAPAAPEFPVNSHTTNWQRDADVAMDAAGNFVVAWQSYDQDGSYEGIVANLFDAGGSPVGSEFQVNTYTTDAQLYPAVALGAGGDFVVAWQSNGQDGSAHGVFAQRYVAPDACGLLDADADGLGDACDVALLAPVAGEGLDCASPGSGRPWIVWNKGTFDRFMVQISWDPSFTKGQLVSSGSELKRGTSWRPSAKKWRRVCRNAATDVFVRVLGIDRDLPSADPDRQTYSNVVQAAAVN